jgi:diguanylate cyclase (GGDEF)-like protein/PAS domain S-box-containing protein
MAFAIGFFFTSIHMHLEKLVDKSPLTLNVQQTLQDALTLLPQSRDKCLLVLAHGQLQGLLTEWEILQALLSKKPPESIAVVDIMQLDVACMQLAELVDSPTALHHLQQVQGQYIPVVDETGCVVGVLNKSNIFQQIYQASIPSALQSQSPDGRSRQTLEQEIAELRDRNTEFLNKIELLEHLEEHFQNNERFLRQSQERLESILSSIEDVVWSVAPETFQLLYVNTATKQVFGRDISEFLQTLNLWLEIIHPSDRPQIEQAYNALQHSLRQELEYRIVWPDLTMRWVRTRMHLVLDDAQRPLRIDGITTDITERKAIQEQLRHDALHDGLTGLANRNLLSDRLAQAFKRYQRQPNRIFAILFLDLDRFKVINDSLGHQVGDQLLITVAQRLTQCQRTNDTIARLGGDEFVILLEDIEDRGAVISVAERVHEMLAQPFHIEGHEIFVTTSIGIAFGAPHLYTGADSVANLIRDADTAMYQAKSLGQGQHAIFDFSMHTAALKQLQIETDLRRVLATRTRDELQPQELQVYYQPIFALDSMQLQGFEALVRWHHPEKGFLSPVDFIPVAEETGLIVPLDQWVITTACTQVRTWQLQFPQLDELFISVNLSSRHFEQPGLLDFLDRMLQETQLSPSALKLEITETTLVKNPETTAVILHQLKDRQIQIALDDFGTGYSSLSYLQAFPLHFLKIDQSFVQQLGHHNSENQKSAIVQAIIKLGESMGISIVAEGIEQQEQASYLQSLNCAYGQGYFFSRPIDARQIEILLQA